MILVVCEGRITEPQYIKQFARYHKNLRVNVEIAGTTGVPSSLVEAAKRFKKAAEKAAKGARDENIAYDSVWCVFDIDDHPGVPEAIDKAASNGIRLAISNPCFELWLLLHLRESPGMNHRDEIRIILKKHVPDYSKHVIFGFFADGYRQAVDRARQLDSLAAQVGEPLRNPTTGVYRLTESILKDDRD